MTVLLTLVLPIGGDAGPFNLYSNLDGYTVPFEVNVSAAALQAGYTSIYVPEGTTTIRVKSVGICTNYVDVPVALIPTTTTTSSSSTSTSTSTSSSTTTSTTTATPTTTTTTTADEPIPSTTTSTTTFNNYRIEDCITLVTYVLPKTFVFSLGDTVQYQVGVPGAGLQRCGVIISTASNLPPTASLVGGVSYPCEDTLHCPTS
jgi:hypothetical protein